MTNKDKIKPISYNGQKKCRKLAEWGGKDGQQNKAN